eukprot:CAMPEP_0202013554 /NCGR_PEP_ID=MMETSP0905-20130828/26543_1 /ASSEMBLY_ACC=CAM_ASM_000554 /TAXON_ID=420261 /ORGANISM="Thalassiosira antarctica, Strain CCMP982" /LENGTH=33 /DNA_ID= /DNA_START= /DNA_END= /DNA_ORIENTATION=
MAEVSVAQCVRTFDDDDGCAAVDGVDDSEAKDG